MDIGTRILSLMDEQDISRHEFARRLHINYSTACGYILNRRLPDCEMLSKISDILNSSSDYLLGRTHLRFPKDLNYSPKESLLVSNFRTLSPAHQDLLLGISVSMQQINRKDSPIV